jgi:hypothetical protein
MYTFIILIINNMSLSKNRLKTMLLPLIIISFVYSVFTFPGLDPSQIDNLVSAQITDSNLIQIMSNSTFIDESGNFHIIGEVNNTSTQTQNNISITALLHDTTNNIIVGNYSAFTSIGTLRTGELSPFDILIPDPQTADKFNFVEFLTTSQPTIEEKPANLVLNGVSSYLDNFGNPHIYGSIINQGQNAEQFLNLVVTIYDNSNLRVIGTLTFGLNVGNLANNQMAPLDITITDNKIRSQGAFYSLNVESIQSKMDFPINSKKALFSTAGFDNSGGSEGGLDAMVIDLKNDGEALKAEIAMTDLFQTGLVEGLINKVYYYEGQISAMGGGTWAYLHDVQDTLIAAIKTTGQEGFTIPEQASIDYFATQAAQSKIDHPSTNVFG